MGYTISAIGIISSKINLEGPLLSENTTYNISARRTYLGSLLKLVAGGVTAISGGKADADVYFYDLNAKINHKISDKDRLFLSAYMGDDVMYVKYKSGTVFQETAGSDTKSTSLTQSVNWNWGNIVSALRWNHVISNKLFMNTSASYTRY